MKVMASAVLAGMLLASHSALGQTPTPLTLNEAIEQGLKSSHRLAEADERRLASEAAIGQQRAAALPHVTTLAGYTRTNHVDTFGILLPGDALRVIYPDVPDNYRARLDVVWPVYTGGRLDALSDAAREESSASAHDVESLRADLRLEISRAFWALVVADESLRVVNESLASTSAQVRDVRNQLDAGLVPPNDVLSAQAQESRQRMLSIQAASARTVAEAELARLIGVDPGTAIQPDATFAPLADVQRPDALVAEARDHRRDRRALLDRLAASASRQDAAVAGTRPTVALAGGVDYANPNPRIFPREEAWKASWDASVNVSWPVFDGGRAKADVAVASAGHRALQARLDELDSVVALEIRQRLAEIESSRAAIAAAEDGLRAAVEARRVVGERFGAGVATSTDVLDAQVAVLQAGLDRTQAMANARIADARLRRALGQ
jgi:outer membrane protein TolC